MKPFEYVLMHSEPPTSGVTLNKGTQFNVEDPSSNIRSVVDWELIWYHEPEALLAPVFDDTGGSILGQYKWRFKSKEKEFAIYPEPGVLLSAEHAREKATKLLSCAAPNPIYTFLQFKLFAEVPKTPIGFQSTSPAS
jgi:hypothetical protein